jgi:hypothetical protein
MTLQKWESIDGIGFFKSERKWSIEVATIRIDDLMKRIPTQVTPTPSLLMVLACVAIALLL